MDDNGDPVLDDDDNPVTQDVTKNYYNIELKDTLGNIVGTVKNYEVVDGDKPPAIGTVFSENITAYTSSRDAGAYSINVDGDNVLSAVITLSDGSTQTVTSGYYELGKSIPITTLATVYDSEGAKHEVTVLIDKDSMTADNKANEAAIATAKIYDDDGNEVTSVQAVRANYDDPDSDDRVIVSYEYDYLDSTGALQTATAELGQVAFENRWKMYIVPQKGEKGPSDASFENKFTK